MLKALYIEGFLSIIITILSVEFDSQFLFYIIPHILTGIKELQMR